jgi:hypothetical protein
LGYYKTFESVTKAFLQNEPKFLAVRNGLDSGQRVALRLPNRARSGLPARLAVKRWKAWQERTFGDDGNQICRTSRQVFAALTAALSALELHAEGSAPEGRSPYADLSSAISL